MTRVAAYVPDLMDRSKVGAAVPDAAFVSTPAALADLAAEVYVVDLTRPGVLEVLPSLTGRVVGFAGHAQRATFAAAREAGCTEALKRSEFFARLPAILTG
jgi:hypothetical protein